jgi:hypothetical protein
MKERMPLVLGADVDHQAILSAIRAQNAGRAADLQRILNAIQKREFEDGWRHGTLAEVEELTKQRDWLTGRMDHLMAVTERFVRYAVLLKERGFWARVFNRPVHMPEPKC